MTGSRLADVEAKYGREYDDPAVVRLGEDQEGNGRTRRSFTVAEMLAEDVFCLEPPLTTGFPGIASGRTTLVVAPPKGGKSTLMAWVAARVSRGEGTPDGEPGDVLIVQMEGHPSELLRALVGFRANINRVHVQRGVGHLDHLTEEVEEVQPSIMFLDTLASLVASLDDIKDAQGDSIGWTRLFNGLASIAREPPYPAIVLNHHTTKTTGKYRDSSAIGGSVDMILTMAEGKADPTERVFTPLGRWHVDPFSVRLDGDRFVFVGDNDLATPGDPTAAVLAFLHANPGASQNEIKKGVPKNAPAVVEAIKSLDSEGLIHNSGSAKNHKWRVRAPVPDTPSGLTSDPPSDSLAPLEVSPPENGSRLSPEPLRTHPGTGSQDPGSPGVGSPLRGTHPDPVGETKEEPTEVFERGDAWEAES